MHVDIQGSAIARRAAVRRHVEQRALFELARFGEQVQVVRLRVSLAGPDGQVSRTVVGRATAPVSPYRSNLER